jgi:DNA polymerase III delta prime subunit
MEESDIHQDIKKKLKTFIVDKKIPHIIFYGPSGSGKRHILRYFINNIYTSQDDIKRYVMYINCAHSKGIRFIRDELKFFAKTNIHLQQGKIFKSIVLFNADKLTTDAQSALRRCIEQFSRSTRFFIVIENQNKLLKPILSRFCNIYIRLPIINGKETSLHLHKKTFIQAKYKTLESKRLRWLTNQLDKKSNYSTIEKCLGFSTKLYEKAYSALDIMHIIYTDSKMDNKRKFAILIYFDKVRKEFRNEMLLLSFIINVVFMRPELCLGNIQEI